jgi:hypothetical protein
VIARTSDCPRGNAITDKSNFMNITIFNSTSG